MGGEALEEQVEVVAGELPLEGLGAGLLAGLDGEQARFDLLQVDQVMTTQPYTSARRMFLVVDNGSSHRGQRSVDRLRDAKVGVAWGDPRQVDPGRMASSASHRQMVVPKISATSPRVTASARISGTRSYWGQDRG